MLDPISHRASKSNLLTIFIAVYSPEVLFDIFAGALTYDCMLIHETNYINPLKFQATKIEMSVIHSCSNYKALQIVWECFGEEHILWLYEGMSCGCGWERCVQEMGDFVPRVVGQTTICLQPSTGTVWNRILQEFWVRTHEDSSGPGVMTSSITV